MTTTTRKVCLKCLNEMPFAMFSKNKRKRDGFDTYCKACTSERSREHFAKNKDRRREQNIQWNSRNPEKGATYCAKWRERNPGAQGAADAAWYKANRAKKLAADKARREVNIEAFLQRERESYVRNKEAKKERHRRWAQENPDRIRGYAARRREAIKQQTPPWLTDDDIEAIIAVYRKAKTIEFHTGEPHHVDHIVPLKGRRVCGLHVPWNLQCLPKLQNLSKSNKHVS